MSESTQYRATIQGSAESQRAASRRRCASFVKLPRLRVKVRWLLACSARPPLCIRACCGRAPLRCPLVARALRAIRILALPRLRVTAVCRASVAAHLSALQLLSAGTRTPTLASWYQRPSGSASPQRAQIASAEPSPFVSCVQRCEPQRSHAAVATAAARAVCVIAERSAFLVMYPQHLAKRRLKPRMPAYRPQHRARRLFAK